MDVLLAIPGILLSLSIIIVTGFGSLQAAFAVGMTSVATFARLARSQVIQIAGADYVEAAYGSGATQAQVLLRHVLPNIAAPLIVQTSLSLAFAILSEAALSFLGLGIQPPEPSLGRMIFDSQGFVTLAWWMAVFPGAAIFAIVLAFNLLGDGLRDVLDPKQRTLIESRRKR